jgi:hypothetical protein
MLREVALTYRRARRAGKDQSEAVDAAFAEYRRLSPFATGPSRPLQWPVSGVMDFPGTSLYGLCRGS